MIVLRAVFYAFSRRERILFLFSVIVFFASTLTRGVLVIGERSQFVPVEGGEYSEGVVGQPTAINPIISGNQIDQDISSLIYSPLGALIEGINVEGEGKSYAVKLKENLVWDDGAPLTSDDVIFTVRTIQNPEIRSPLAKNWQGVMMERISELQLKFSLPAPYVFFRENINRLPVLPRHIFGSVPPSNIRLSSFNLEPVGSGPYKFVSFKRRKDGFITEYHLKANKKYVGDRLYIQDFYFKFYEDKDDLISAFRAREVDGFGILNLPPESVYSLPHSVVKKISMPRYYAVFFNPKATSLLQKQDFRKALSLAIDKEKMVENVLAGEASVIEGPVVGEPSVYNGPDKEFASGTINDLKEEESVVIKLIIPEVDFIEKTAEFVKKEWESVGVDEVSIVMLGPDDFFNTVIRQRNYEAVIFGNLLENPLDLFPFWHSSERFYPGLNLSIYSNKEVDRALEKIRQTDDNKERMQEFKKAVELIKSDNPAVFLFTLPYTYVYNNRLKGFSVKDYLVMPSDRFSKMAEWYVKEVRVFK